MPDTPEAVETATKEVQEDLDVLIGRAERRLENLRGQYRSDAQNLDMFVKDYTAMMATQFEAIEQAEKVLHDLHGLKVGRPLTPAETPPKVPPFQTVANEPPPPPPAQVAPKIEPPQVKIIPTGDDDGIVIVPPSPQISVTQELGKVESKKQKELREEFEDAPGVAPGYKVTPPDYAVKGPIGTTWSYKAGTDWGPGDYIDPQGRRHVHGRLCGKGHPNPLTRSDCVACKIEMGNPTHAEKRYRIYSMSTGECLYDQPELPLSAPVTEPAPAPAPDVAPAPTIEDPPMLLGMPSTGNGVPS